MAIAYVGKSSSAFSADVSPQVTRTCTAGNLVLVVVAGSDDTHTTTVSGWDAGITSMRYVNGWSSGYHNVIGMAYKIADGGSETFGCTFNNAVTVGTIYAIEFSGFDAGIGNVDHYGGIDETGDLFLTWYDSATTSDPAFTEQLVIAFAMTVGSSGTETCTIGSTSNNGDTFTTEIDAYSIFGTSPVYRHDWELQYVIQPQCTIALTDSALTGDVSGVRDINITAVFQPRDIGGGMLAFSF